MLLKMLVYNNELVILYIDSKNYVLSKSSIMLLVFVRISCYILLELWVNILRIIAKLIKQ